MNTLRSGTCGLRWVAFMGLAFLMVAAGVASAEYTPRPYPEGFDPNFVPVGSHIDKPAKALPFEDTMENGSNGWSSTGYWHLVTNPEQYSINSQINPRLVHLPDNGALPAAHGGSACWWYSEDSTGTFIGANYDKNQKDESGGTSKSSNSGSLISPPINLTNAQSARLNFWVWWEIEGVDVDRYDMMYVEVSTDNGVTFGNKPFARLNPLNDVDGQSWRSYSSGGLGEIGQWQEVSLDLAPYVGNNVVVRFRFNTVDHLYNGFRGWLIDDVKVESQLVPTPPVITEIMPGAGSPTALIDVIGENFFTNALVTLNGPLGASAPKTYNCATVVSNTSLAQFIVPAAPLGQYQVTLTNPDGLADTADMTFEITKTPAPDVKEIYPGEGFDTDVTNVTLRGDYFQSGIAVYVDEIAPENLCPSIAFESSTIVRCQIPAGLPAGYRNIVVQNPDDQIDRLIGGFLVKHQYTLTTTASVGGSVTPEAGTHVYPLGSSVTLSATPDNGWVFDRWEGDVSGDSATIIAAITGDVQATAVFAPILTMSVLGEGSVTPPVGSDSVAYNTTVNLSATPAEGWRFVEWTGAATGTSATSSVVMDAPKSVTAVFTKTYSLMTTVSGEGTVDPASGIYDAGTQVSVTATPAEGYRFVQWNGDVVSYDPTITVVMDGDRNITAVFVAEYQVTFTKIGDGGMYPPAGTSFNVSAGSVLGAQAFSVPGWRFDHWEADASGTDPFVTVTVAGDTTITAVFVQEFQLLVNTTGIGSVTPQVGFSAYETGAVVPLSAVPASGWRFVSWSGDLASSSASDSILMNGDKSVVANFAQEFALNLSQEGEGNVALDPASSTPYLAGTQVTATATAAANWRFDHWEGSLYSPDASISFSMDTDMFLKAVFVRNPMLTVVTQGEGTVTPSVGEHYYTLGEVVPLSATAAVGWRFAGWMGDVVYSLNSTESVDMFMDRTVVAMFVQQFTLTLTANGNGSVYPASGVYDAGMPVQVVAIPDNGYQFTEWTGDITGSDSYQTVIMDSDKAATATFSLIPPNRYTLNIEVEGKGETDPAAGSHVYNGPTIETPADEQAVTAIPATGWEFMGWQGDYVGAELTTPSFVMDANHSVLAVFNPTLNVTVSPDGGGTVAPVNGPYPIGASVELVATPESGWRFDQWVDADDNTLGNTPILQVVMNDAVYVTAYFVRQYDVTIATIGNGSVEPFEGTRSFDGGSLLSLAATPDDGWRFGGWSGDATGSANTASLVVDDVKMVDATFVQQFILTVAAQGAGVVTPGVGAHVYDADAPVALSAVAASGYEFLRWEGAATGTDASTSITMDADKAVTAVFSPLYELIVDVEGQGTVTPDGGLYSTNDTADLTAAPATGWRFDRWEGDASGDSLTTGVLMDGPKRVRAIFIQQFTLTVSKTGEGDVSFGLGQFTLDAGTPCAMIAMAADGWRFDRWTGDVPSADPQIVFTVDGDMAVNAEFVQQYPLTVNVTGGGNVTPFVGTQMFDVNSTVNLLASAEDGWRFDKWEGSVNGNTNSLAIEMDSAQEVTAVFVQQFKLNVTVVGQGQYSVNPEATAYDIGAQVSLEATPAAGWLFSGWEGDVTGGSRLVNFAMDSNKAITLVFVEVPTLSVTPSSQAVDYTMSETWFTVSRTNAAAGPMPWVAVVVKGQDWLWLASNTSGMDESTVRLAFAENGTRQERTGVVRITAAGSTNKSVDVTVVQAGRPLPASLVVSPRQRSIGAKGGDTSFTVTNSGVLPLAWSAELTTAADWIYLTGTTSGTVSSTLEVGSINVTCAANDTRESRFAEITVTAQDAEGSPRVVKVYQPGRDADGVVGGMVTNSITGAPIEGVFVEISVDNAKYLKRTVTDVDGNYRFENLKALPPYEITFKKTEYIPAKLPGVFYTEKADVALEPMGISVPYRPDARSAARSVVIEWTPNPEYNVKGYSIYRTEVLSADNPYPMSDRVKLNGDPESVYDGLLTAPNFTDSNVEKGVYYIYQIQAVSGADRPSKLSEPSNPPVKGEWLTIYFPDMYLNTSTTYLWDRTNTEQPELLIPICARCSYEVSTFGMGIVAYLPKTLVHFESLPTTMAVESSGITAGMVFSANITEGTTDAYKVMISAAADADPISLFGNGVLFYLRAGLTSLQGCGWLDLVEDIPNGDGYTGRRGVRLYGGNIANPQRLDVELEDGVLCSEGGCVHGDVNGDGLIDEADVMFINMLWVEDPTAEMNACSMFAGDINQDGVLDMADAAMILRWLAGYPIAQVTTAKSEDVESISFAAAARNAKATEVAPTASLTAVSGDPGTEVTVTMMVENAVQMAGFTAIINYPAGDTGLTFVSASLGSGLDAATYDLQAANRINSDGTKGTLRLSATNSDVAKAQAVEVATLTFLVGDLAVPTDVLPIVLSSFTVSDPLGYTPKYYAPNAPITMDGSVEVTGEIPIEGQPEGEPIEGQPEGEPIEGQPEGEPIEGTPAEGAPAEGQPAEGQAAEGQTAEGQVAEGQPAEGQVAEEGQSTSQDGETEGDTPASSGCFGS